MTNSTALKIVTTAIWSGLVLGYYFEYKMNRNRMTPMEMEDRLRFQREYEYLRNNKVKMP
jgi:hypothetical protein